MRVGGDSGQHRLRALTVDVDLVTAKSDSENLQTVQLTVAALGAIGAFSYPTEEKKA